VTPVTEAAALARLAGLRPTSQRVAIIKALEGRDRPVTAQVLHEEVRGPGLATVYRTLRALADTGVAETFPAGEGEVAYRLCEVDHHHHLICERCGQVISVPSCEVGGWATAVGRRRGFRVTGHRADVYGICQSCRVGGRARRSPRNRGIERAAQPPATSR
jgi:Fur family ferric uptake transcriptional regulator